MANIELPSDVCHAALRMGERSSAEHPCSETFSGSDELPDHQWPDQGMAVQS